VTCSCDGLRENVVGTPSGRIVRQRSVDPRGLRRWQRRAGTAARRNVASHRGQWVTSDGDICTDDVAMRRRLPTRPNAAPCETRVARRAVPAGQCQRTPLPAALRACGQ
jgi:hypothetical protein